MNAEVTKSNKKLDKLHAEFGLEMMNAWQTEHALEVLQPHEQDLVKQAQYQSQNAQSWTNQQAFLSWWQYFMIYQN